MDKDSMFKPTKEEACKLVNNYWDNLDRSTEKILDDIARQIRVQASEYGRNNLTYAVLKESVDYVKEKLEDVGYIVTLEHDDEKYRYIEISF